MIMIIPCKGDGTSVAIRFKSSRRYMPLVAGVLLTVLSQIQAGAATIFPADASFPAVQTAVNSALNGDTVVIPAGTATWSSTLTIGKAITLQGAGIGQTIIKDGLSGTTLLMRWTIPANLPSRLTGIDFQDGGTRVGGGVAIIEFDGSNINGSTLRVDNSSFNLKGFVNFETIIGVVDHNVFWSNSASPLRINDTFWNDPTQLSGDKSWTDPPGYGSSQCLFIEDNIFSSSSSTPPGCTDAYDGARFVLRHNTFNNNIIPQNHGTESHGRGRGCRVMEIYNNTYIGTNVNKFLGGCRSGSVLFHDNNISGFWQDAGIFGFANQRLLYPFPVWGQADGTNPWDTNDTADHTGNGYGGGPNGVFATGTAASASSGTTVTVTGASWTTNQWVDYVVRRTSNLGNVTTMTSAGIMSNTANTITYTGSLGNSQLTVPILSFASGDTLEIRKLVKVLDGVGVGQGSLVQDSPPGSGHPVVPTGWNDQVAEPCYSWNNVNELGHTVNFAPNSPGMFLLSGVHYFNNTRPPFSYTPYTYPHPLVSGALAAPQDLHVTQ
jgi:hypothetical protein